MPATVDPRFPGVGKPWKPCCCQRGIGGAVLLWVPDNTAHIRDVMGNNPVMRILEQHYLGRNLTVHRPSTWTGNLFDYRLVVFPEAESNPPWWTNIDPASRADQWPGRLHITAGYVDFLPSPPLGFMNSVIYVDSKSNITGTRMWAGKTNTTGQNPVLPNPLTDGLATINTGNSGGGGGTSYVDMSRGNLSVSSGDGLPWMTRNKPLVTECVTAGSSAHFEDFFYANAADPWPNNYRFADNLYDVPIG